jgi:hypothetical protein
MLTRVLFFLSLLLTITLFLTGAWTGTLTPSAAPAEDAFVPKALPLDADIIGSGIDGRQLLEKASAKLRPARMAWLKTKIRQTMTDARSNFVAEGFLQRGPNQCARLEMDIDTNGQRGRLLVVSDGAVVAQVRETPGEKPAVTVEELMEDAAEREAFLDGKGAGGPLMLLQQFQKSLQNVNLRTGTVQGRGVIQIKGDLEPTSMSVCACTSMPVRVGYVYLGAATLWPTRMEWHGLDKEQTLRPILRIDFLEPQVNEVLSDAECAKQFSYQPK